MLKRIRMFFVMLAALMLIAAPAMASGEPIRVSTFEQLKNEAKNKTTRIIVLENNIKETTEYLTINGTLTLDLNGHTLDITPEHYTSAIYVRSDSHLIIKNAGTITTAKEILFVYEGAALTISDGTFFGPIDIEDKSQTNITGGAFSVSPQEYLKEGYEAKREADGLYHVRRKTAEEPSIKFEQKELTLYKGETADIMATISGIPDGMDYEVTPTCDSEAVRVELADKGANYATFTVTGMTAGNAELTATMYYGWTTYSDSCHIIVKNAEPTPPGPIDVPPTPVNPVIGNVSDDVKAEIKPELAVPEGDPAAAAKKIGGTLAAEQLTRNKDGNTIVEPEVAVKAANKLGALSSVTSKDVVALPVFTTPAIDANKDKTIMISYLILGSDLKAKKPADVKVMKILGAENGKLFTYASAITKDMDKKFTVMKDDDSGTIFTGEIDGYTMYRLALFIKDGGKFDLDGKKDDAVADPTVILGAEKRAPGGSSGGCNAGLGVLALLLSLAAIPLVYKRKK